MTVSLNCDLNIITYNDGIRKSVIIVANKSPQLRAKAIGKKGKSAGV